NYRVRGRLRPMPCHDGFDASARVRGRRSDAACRRRGARAGADAGAAGGARPGAIRGGVWGAVHDRALDAVPRDIDVGFYDASDLTPERDRGVEEALSARAPHLPWEAKNQEAVHLWYPRR